MSDLKLVYSAHRIPLAEGEAYRNPRFFTGPEAGVTAVRIVGDWPKIAAAYRRAGVDVVADSPAAAAQPFECLPPPTTPVTIPEGWRALPWPELRALAAQCGARWAINRTQAIAAIEKQEAEQTGIPC
jgi:hypothetical protein